MRMRPALLLALAIVAGAPAAIAQIAPIKGWSLHEDGSQTMSDPTGKYTLIVGEPLADEGADVVFESYRRAFAQALHVQPAPYRGRVPLDGYLVEQFELTPPGGQRLRFFLASPSSGGQRRMITVVSRDSSPDDPVLRTILAHVGNIGRSRTMLPISTSLPAIAIGTIPTAAQSVKDAPSTTSAPPMPAAGDPPGSSTPAAAVSASFGPPTILEAPYLRPDRGIGDAAVKTVVLHASYSMIRRSFTVDIYVFLKDGRVFDSVKGSPRDFDPVAAGDEVAHGRWTAAGSGASVRWSNRSQEESVDGPLDSTAAPADLRFTASFKPMGYVSENQRLNLRADGTFTTVGGFEVQARGSSGHYRISGYTIELAYASGDRTRQLFAITKGPTSQPTSIVIGSQTLGRQ